MGTLRRSKQRTDAFLLARPAGSLSNFKESSKRACSQAKSPLSQSKDAIVDIRTLPLTVVFAKLSYTAKTSFPSRILLL
jgi:hypothetical protein